LPSRRGDGIALSNYEIVRGTGGAGHVFKAPNGHHERSE
jgi:hypothetical protein